MSFLAYHHQIATNIAVHFNIFYLISFVYIIIYMKTIADYSLLFSNIHKIVTFNQVAGQYKK